MAVSQLVVKIFADANGVKTGVDAAKRELDRLNSTIAQVSDKFASAFPKNFAGTAKNIGTEVGNIAASMTRLSGALGGLAVGALVNDFLNATGKLTDLSAQTDITVNKLQRFQFAGDLVGVSLDQITAAVGQLQNRLGSLDKSGLAALDKLGLHLRDIQGLDPGTQFETIASAIAKIPDPSQRAAIAMDLFGRAGVTLLPLLKSDLKAVGDEAERIGAVMSDETVKAGDDLGDAFTRLKAFGRGLVVDALEPLLIHLNKLDSEKQRFVNMFDAVGLSVKGLSADVQDLGRWFDVIRGKAGALPALPSAPTGGAGLPVLPTTAEGADLIMKDLAIELDRVREKSAAAAKAAKDYAAAQKELRTASVELVERGFKRQVEEQTKLLGQLPFLRQHLDANRLALLSNVTQSQDYAGATDSLVTSMQGLIATGQVFKAENDTNILKFLRDAGVETRTWQGELSALSTAMTQLSQTASSSVVNALASMVNGINAGSNAVTSLKGGFSDLTSGKGLSSILSGFTGIVSGIGGIVSAAQTAIQIGKALFDIFDRNKGRDLVEDFAAEFGGFDPLHKLLNQLGEEGERLWIMLTQGVGRNNPGQAQTAIDAVRKALESLTGVMRTDVDRVIDDINQKKIRIPVEIVVESVEGGTMTVPAFAHGGIVRKPTLALIGEAGPEAVVPLGRGIAGGGTIHTHVYLEGREVQGVLSSRYRTRYKQSAA